MYMITASLALILAVSAAFALTLSIRIFRASKKYNLSERVEPAIDPPSVSVCIPARNETHAMAKCLEMVLASDYRKLEVVVFDDNSADDTSIIIRSFAQAGVRFVAGTGPAEGWLGKNYALDVLAKEASGTYVVFMDVDTTISSETISHLVDYITKENAQMVSVVPGRADGWRLSVLFGHLRYFWELATVVRPFPVASALWMVDRRVLLDDLGGFEKFKSSPMLEAETASPLFNNGLYRCLVSGNNLDVYYEKKWSSQIETSKRLLYPMAGGTISGVMKPFFGLIALNFPLFIILGGFFAGWSYLQYFAGLVMIINMLAYGIYTRLLWHKAVLVGAILWPIVALQELFLVVYSTQAYLRGTVTWKGRSIYPFPETINT